jgi:hypothetical protein
MRELIHRTLTDERQFKLTIRVALISAFVLGFAVGFITGGWALFHL